MIKTVIFDMDGVIVDTEPVHRYAYFQHFDELDIVITEEMFTSFTGNSTRNVFQRIKELFNLEHDVEDLIQRKRAIFNELKPNLVFNNVTVSGVNTQQKKYIERLFKSDNSTFNLADIKRGYYKLVADETFETIYPKISYQPSTDSYNFEIVAQPKRSFKIDFGGNISSRPISNVYLGLQYSYLNRKAYTFSINFYSGRISKEFLPDFLY